MNVSNCVSHLQFDYSSDARYFVATGVLSMLYSLAISVVYIKFDEMYKSNSQLPLIVSLDVRGVISYKIIKWVKSHHV